MKKFLQLCLAFMFVCSSIVVCYGASAECEAARTEVYVEEFECKFTDHNDPRGEHCKAAEAARRWAKEACSSFFDIGAPGQQYDDDDL